MLTSPAPNSLSLSLDIDDQANCVNVDTLIFSIVYFYPENATKYRFFVEEDIAFADTDVVFMYIPPGNDGYICDIIIFDTNATQAAEYVSFPCGNPTVLGEF